MDGECLNTMNDNDFSNIEKTSTSALRTRYFGELKAHGFRYIPTQEEILTLVIGDPKPSDAPLVRIHSRCLTGDVFGSIQCECGEQLEYSLEKMDSEGSGILIYLEQEGRGCGLVAKLRAYEMFEKDGIDTVDAYLRMNLPIDGRSYDAAVLILRYLGIQKLRLLTNNPLKIQAFNDSGIEVERVPIDIPPNPWNKDYLKTKKLRMGHLLGNL